MRKRRRKGSRKRSAPSGKLKSAYEIALAKSANRHVEVVEVNPEGEPLEPEVVSKIIAPQLEFMKGNPVKELYEVQGDRYFLLERINTVIAHLPDVKMRIIFAGDEGVFKNNTRRLQDVALKRYFHYKAREANQEREKVESEIGTA